MEVAGKSSSYDYSALELSSRFRRYSQAALVIELSFKVVQQGFPFTLAMLVDLVPWFLFLYVAVWSYPLLPTDDIILPTITH